MKMKVRSSMVTQVEKVTPALAKQWLKKRRITRKIVPGKVRRYANLMKHGRWTLTSQGFSFDNEGYLVNGQHRCLAVVLSGVTILANVTRGEPAESLINIDGSDMGRSIAAAMSSHSGRRVGSAVAAIVNNMLISEFSDRRPDRFPTHVYVDFYEKHASAIDFVMEQFRTNCRGISQAPLKAALAKAWYHARKYKGEDGGRDRLRALCDILKSGIPVDISRDQAALVLKNHVQSGRFDKSGSNRNRIYLRMAYCIDKFMRGENIATVKMAKSDPFPLADSPVLDTLDADIEANLAAEIAAAEAILDEGVSA